MAVGHNFKYMIYINSSFNDNSTDCVQDWIYFLSKQNIIRANDFQQITSFTYKINNQNEEVNFNTESNQISTEVIKSYWYRRGGISFNNIKNESIYPRLGVFANKYIEREFKFISKVLENCLKNKLKGINIENDNYTNKIENLSIAKKVKLSIPDSIICTDWSELIEFCLIHRNIISKPIIFGSFEFPNSSTEQIFISSGVIKLDHSELMEIKSKCENSSFSPSLFQVYIEKKFELRIFYLNGQCYSMAIFSQSNVKTKIDFRNYDYERPNRCVPYQLPKEIEQKINAFMHAADLNCGSLDMIYSTDNQYVFLEVNPIGQYQWLTNNCNYFIDRLIAQTLTQ
ncbi:MAG: grasp-with-spasm system ATP-grasp peptide maturase [Phycisphaerales bacterium]|nr:grasp-with-spasm system ATP-grasp peptide maturase [Phycisphaerales bacterium]